MSGPKRYRYDRHVLSSAGISMIGVAIWAALAIWARNTPALDYLLLIIGLSLIRIGLRAYVHSNSVIELSELSVSVIQPWPFRRHTVRLADVYLCYIFYSHGAALSLSLADQRDKLEIERAAEDFPEIVTKIAAYREQLPERESSHQFRLPHKAYPKRSKYSWNKLGMAAAFLIPSAALYLRDPGNVLAIALGAMTILAMIVIAWPMLTVCLVADREGVARRSWTLAWSEKVRYSQIKEMELCRTTIGEDVPNQVPWLATWVDVGIATTILRFRPDLAADFDEGSDIAKWFQARTSDSR